MSILHVSTDTFLAIALKPGIDSSDAPNSPHWVIVEGEGQFGAQTALPLQRSPPYLIHPSLDWPHSPPQTASRSNQPFCHNTLCRLTDRPNDWQTDGPGKCSVMSAALAMLIDSDVLIMIQNTTEVLSTCPHVILNNTYSMFMTMHKLCIQMSYIKK